MITFNNIVERFEIFAENHFFIQTFSFGSPDDVDLTKFTNFPLMHLVYTGATYDAGTKTYNLEVYILDVPADKNQKVERQKEVVSDAEQCAEDIISDIKNGGNIFLFAQDYEVINATTTPLEEETKNVLSGVLLDLSVAIPYEWDACNAPIDGVEPGGTEVTYARRGVLRMLTLDGATDVSSVRTIKVTNGTLTDDGDGVVTLDTGGVDTLAGLTDVDVTGVTDGQVLKYDDASGEWLPGNDQSATSLANLDDVSLVTPANREALIYDGDNWVNDNVTKADVGLGNVDNTSDADKPVSTATQTALNLKANTADVPTELNDLSDVSLTTPTANQALIYNTAASAFQALPSYTNRFQDEAEQASNTAVTGTTLFIERYYSAKADGDGIFIDAQSDTPSAGKVIERKIYQIAGGLDDSTVTGWTLIHTFADDTAYSATTSTFEGFRDGDTYGTPPFSLAQTWEEVTAAPAFTGLLNESYGSGAEAAYSTRRLNGNVTDCMVIRRASDSTTTTIGFVNGDIDESAIETFCTGTTCTVYQWLDQSGNGNTATAPSTGAEPTIYTGGALVKEKGKVAVDFDGSNDYLSANGVASPFTGLSKPLSSFVISQSTATALKPVYAFGSSSTNNSLRWFGTSPAGNNQCGFQERDDDGSPNVFIDGGSMSVQNLGTIITNGDNNRTIFVDGISEENNTSDVDTITLNQFAIGALDRTSVSNYWDGIVQEIVLYSTEKTSVRTSIESNIGDYFTQNTPLLDTYSGAAAAYSLRLLDSTYTGALINVWNGTSYADIYPNVFGELDTVALAAHCGSNDGFIRYWYDQSSNGNTATQTTTANMPKIYDGTTGVVTENGKPALLWQNTASQNLALPTLTLTTKTVTGVFTPRSGATSRYISSYGGSGSVSSEVIIDYTSTGNIRLLDGETNASTAISVGQLLPFAYRNSSEIAIGANGGTLATTATTATSSNSNSIKINDEGGGAEPSEYHQEVLIWDSDQSANRTGIEDNINTFYSIY